MATSSGTATDHLDLLSRLVTFLTGVGMGSQAWTVMRNTGSEVILRGPGLAGADQIFVGMKVLSDASADYYDWILSGFTGYDGALAFEAQPGAHHVGWGAGQSGPLLTLWNKPMDYWFVASGRRIYVVAQVSTVYVSACLGLLETPYASPGQWPYPLVVAGNQAWSGAVTPTGNVALRWSYTGEENRAFWNPRASISGRASQLRLRWPDGSWFGFAQGDLWPISGGASDLRPQVDGSLTRLPILLSTASPTNILGELGQVQFVSGHAIAARDTLTEGADTWLVMQNVHRTTKTDYAALKLA